MSLYSVAQGATVEALDVTQFYNLLTGVMTDQPVTLGNILSVSPGTYRGSLGVGTASPNYFGWTNSSVATVYGGTNGGTVEVVSTAADGASASVGQLAFEGTMNAGHETRLAVLQALSAGATAGNRGGQLVLSTKADGGALTQAMIVDAAQRVTIGALTPYTPTQLGQSNAGPLLEITGTGASNFATLAFSTDQTTSAQPGVVVFSLPAIAASEKRAAVLQVIQQSTDNTSDMVFYIGSANTLTEKMRVRSNGHVTHGGASPTLGASQSNVASQSIVAGTDNGLRVTVTMNGTGGGNQNAAVVSYGSSWGVIPSVAITPENSGVYCATGASSTSGFNVFANGTLSASTAYTFSIAIQGATA